MANEKRLIYVDDIKHEQKNILFMGRNAGKMKAMLNDVVTLMITNCPTVDAVEVVHGRWLLERTPDGRPYCFHCSVCDDDFSCIGVDTAYRYCPRCGAKMDGGDEDG